MADKIPRELPEQIEALRKHLGLLDEYYKRAFEKGEEEFYGEIACKLRLLAIKTNANKPLLIKIQNITGKNYKYASDRPGGKTYETLNEYMAGLGCAIRNSDGELKECTRREIILMYSEQNGACHEDSSISDELHKMLNEEIRLSGIKPVHSLLGSVTRTVLNIGNDLLTDFSKPETDSTT